MCFNFSDNIRALKDVWFIGDHFFRHAFPYLQQIQQEHTLGKENYLHSNYDTYGFYPAFTETNVLTMVRNCFVEGMNRRLRLPSAVIILLSDQLIIEDPLYLPSEVDRKIKWILRELEAAVKIRKSSLPLKAYTLGEPRFMWVRAFQDTRANYLSHDLLLKFNNMLWRICMAKAVYTVPTDTYDDAHVRCFDFDGKTQIKEGFELIWHDIIRGLKKHDESDKHAEIANIIYENTPKTKSNCKGDGNLHRVPKSRDYPRSNSSSSRRGDRHSPGHSHRSPRRSSSSRSNYVDYDRPARSHRH